MGRLIVSVSQNAVLHAESELLSCDRCSSHATMPFWQVLHSLRPDQAEGIVYILPVLASCPSCQAPIDEITLVEPRAAATRRPTNRVLSKSEA